MKHVQKQKKNWETEKEIADMSNNAVTEQEEAVSIEINTRKVIRLLGFAEE